MSNSAPLLVRSQTMTVLMLALLLGLQPVTTDLYLPALPALTQVFGASMVQAQLTLTALLLAFGTSQLVWGPLSDKWGRRPVLLGGIGVYVVSAIACALAPDIETLIAARTLQGVAMGACVMAARAIVRDLYEPVQGAKIMSQALSGLGFIACTCVPVGGFLTDLLGWRWALSSLILFAAFTGALIYFYFDESLQQRNPHALQVNSLWAAVKHIVRNPTFQAYSALSTASFAGLFTFLATSSFVFTQSMGLSKTVYGLLMVYVAFVHRGHLHMSLVVTAHQRSNERPRSQFCEFVCWRPHAAGRLCRPWAILVWRLGCDVARQLLFVGAWRASTLWPKWLHCTIS